MVLARRLALSTLVTSTLALDLQDPSRSARTCPLTSNTASAGALPPRSTVTSTVTITRTPDLPLGGGSTGSCAATSNTITVTRTHTVTTTSTSTSTHTASGATDAPSPSSSAHLPQPPPSSSSNTRPTASASETTSAAQNASQAIVTAFFTPGGLPSIGPLQNYTLPVPSGSHHSSETSPAPHPSDSPSAKPPEQSPSASPDSSAATGSSTGSGANPGSTPGAGHSTGEKKPCEITVYTYAPTSNCIQTFDSVGACGFTTYFPKFANNGMSKLAVPAEIFDSFGGVAQNNPMCGRTVTITAANGVSRKVMVADRNADPTFDLCMDIWTDFGYTSGGGRFQAHWSLDPA